MKYGYLNDGWSKKDEDGGTYNCYWYTFDTVSADHIWGEGPTFIDDFFKKITFTLEDNGYGENEIILTLPDYQIQNIWNPYTQSYFSKEIVIGTDRYSVVGILK